MGKPVERLAVPEHLLAFDPGADTGVALFRRGKLVSCFVLKNVGTHQWQSIANLIVPFTSIAGSPGCTVVCENYVTPKGLDQHSRHTVELIGWIHGNALCSNLPFFLQMPPVKKPFLDLATDVLADMRKSPKNADHERDAVAHGLAWLARHTDLKVGYSEPAAPVHPDS